ncbi:MAG: type II toxin-antitoxin system Phd/YefM family antitoxin [Magnetococcales bacterium]|nr:type II toxin-antitoxin system Phd/YefM family antitoxin [Magnetococcales bacterium]
MLTLAAREAKNRFGHLMDQAQREPVTIEKNGRPVAVVMSMDEYQQGQQLKLEQLQRDLEIGIAAADRGELLDADKVFTELLED